MSLLEVRRSGVAGTEDQDGDLLFVTLNDPVYIEAAQALGTDADYRKKLSALRDPRVWQAVPRQMQIVLSPCGLRLKSE